MKILFSVLLLVQSACEAMNEKSLSPNADQEATTPQEYCLLESFHPRCWKNEVIAMKSALYGRMYYGRCVKTSQLGCSSNVLSLMDRKCSGKMECDIRIPDSEIHNTKPCPPEMEMFLETSYECVNVIQDSRSCSVPASSQLYISSLSSSSSGCGTKVQPWILEASVGQRVNISLLDFALVESEGGSQSEDSRPCHPLYGYIVDKTGRKNVSICGGQGQRDRALYVSQSNTVTLVLTAAGRIVLDAMEEQATFLLRFEAIGCSFLIPPQDAWLKRQEDELTVGCYSSLQTWTLRCIEHKWTGALGNCSAQYVAEPKVEAHAEDYSQVLVLVAIIVLGMVVCLIIVCAGAVCLKRYKTGCEIPHPEKLSNGSSSRGTFRSLPNSSNSMSYPTTDVNSTPSLLPPTYSVYIGGNTEKTRLARNPDDLQYFVLDHEAVAKENIVSVPAF